jgi:hypothetical protein
VSNVHIPEGNLSNIHQQQMFGLLETFVPSGTLSFHHTASTIPLNHSSVNLSVSLLLTTKILLQNAAPVWCNFLVGWP